MADTRKGKARQQMERRVTSGMAPRARFVDSDEPEVGTKTVKAPPRKRKQKTQRS